MVIDNKYNIGDIVYLRTDQEQKQRIITAIKINPGNLIYILSCDSDETGFYEFEVTNEIDVLKKTQ